MLGLKRLGLGCAAAAVLSTSSGQQRGSGGAGVRAATSSSGSSNDVNFSSAYCKVTAKSFATSDSQSDFVEAWQDISESVCGNETVQLDVTVQAEGVAFAMAEALAEVVAQCETQGTADARARAYAYAQDRAEALGEAVAGVWADVTACDRCSAVVDTFVSVSDLIVANAVAEAWTDVYVYSDAGAQADSLSEVTSHVFIEKVSNIIVQLSTWLFAAVQDGCDAGTIASIDVGELFAECSLSAISGSESWSTDAIADAGAQASAWACNGDIAEAETTVIAQATAEAIVDAYASADVWCETNGANTQACGMSITAVEDIAYAQASAFASAFAQAESCNCNVAAAAATEVWGEIWASAAVNAYAETCAGGGTSDFVSDFKTALSERIIVVTAEAIASAVATGGNQCRVSVDVCSSASSSCARKDFAKCYGPGMDNVLPCCDDNYVCMKRNSRGYYCKSKSFSSRFWDGDIAVCKPPTP